MGRLLILGVMEFKCGSVYERAGVELGILCFFVVLC